MFRSRPDVTVDLELLRKGLRRAQEDILALQSAMTQLRSDDEALRRSVEGVDDQLSAFRGRVNQRLRGKGDPGEVDSTDNGGPKALSPADLAEGIRTGKITSWP